MIGVVKKAVHSAGRQYCRTITKSEYDAQAYRRINERPIEYRFVFEAIRLTTPKTVLDVGTGESALPSLMRTCGPVVTAVDNIRDDWPEGVVNRHFHIKDEDATKAISGKYDMVTCISVLEHIKEHDDAVRIMLGALNPGGHLVLTCPYSEKRYIDNVYQMPGAGYGQDAAYVCQMYSRANLDRWFGNATVVKQEYWRVFSGEWWTFGETLRPALETTQDQLHQLTCLLVRKNG